MELKAYSTSVSSAGPRAAIKEIIRSPVTTTKLGLLEVYQYR